MLPKIEYHEEIQEPPRLIMVDHIECFEFHFENLNQEEFKHLLQHGGTIPRTQLDAKKEIHKDPLIEDIIENPPHDAIEYLNCTQDYFSEEDYHIGTIDLPK